MSEQRDEMLKDLVAEDAPLLGRLAAWADGDATVYATPIDREALAFDPVTRPRHYNVDPSGVECIQITRHRNFNVGNAIKYLWRAGLKGKRSETEVEDLRKAVFYIQDEITRLTGAQAQ